jgi:hypothetical protein
MLEILLISVLVLGAMIVIPLIALCVVGKLVIALILLPFRIIGAFVGAVVGVFGVVAKVLLVGAAAIVGLTLLAGGLALIPLIPVVLLALVVWLLARLFRTTPTTRPAA